jgi:hypothetical protein
VGTNFLQDIATEVGVAAGKDEKGEDSLLLFGGRALPTGAAENFVEVVNMGEAFEAAEGEFDG